MLGRADQGRDRKPVAQRLAQTGEVGAYAVMLLGAAGREAQPGDDLVEDGQRPVLVDEVDQRLELARTGLVGPRGLDDHRRVLTRVALQGTRQRVQVPGPDGLDQRHHRLRDAALPGRGSDVPVVPSVVAGGDHALAPGQGPGQPHRRRGRLRAGLGEAHALHPWHRGHDPLGDLHLESMGKGEADPVLKLRGDPRPHRRVTVTEDDRAQGHREVQVLVAVHVPDPAAVGASQEVGRDALSPLRRALAHRLRGAGNDPARAGQQLLGARQAALRGSELAGHRTGHPARSGP